MPDKMTFLPKGVAALAVLFLFPGWSSAQESQVGRTATVVPDPQYEAGGFHRFYFGAGYRDVWTAAVELEYLDLQEFAGGLTPTGVGGGMQTRSLRFVGNDGRPYTFRPLRKSLLDVIPDYMRDTFLEDIVQDQVSSALPTGAPIATVLLEAVNVLHSEPKLVVIPDDPLLGEHREHFAGRAGSIEEWPNEGPDGTPGFAGATNVISTEELFEVLKSDPEERVDAEKYFTARIVDVLIGDWDRHQGQFRWANVGDGSPPAWVPIPEDRDQAFARFDGIFMSAARIMVPQLTKFDEGYGSMLGMTWNGRNMDRQFLVGFEEDTFDLVAASVQAKLTDAVLEQAVRRLPDEHYALIGDKLTSALQKRRDHIPEMVRGFYRHLAGEVDVHCTDQVDILEVVREKDGVLDLAIYSDGGGDSVPRLRRRFDPDETGEVRVYLYGGNDRVTVSGEGKNKITLRVVSGEGDDQITDGSRPGGTRVYDSREVGGVVDSEGIKVDRRSYTPPPHPPDQLPPPDWGSRTTYLGLIYLSGDLGLVVGGGLSYKQYGFRKHPHAWRIDPSAAISTGKTAARLEVTGEKRAENSNTLARFRILGSGIESLNFFGFGNETKEVSPDSSDVEQNVLHFEPGIGFDLSADAVLTFGLPIRYSATEKDSTTIVGSVPLPPYGIDDLWQAGLRAHLEWDTRDHGSASRKGVHLLAEGVVYPEILEVEFGSFGYLDADVTGYYSPLQRLTFAGRVGGKKVWGDFPYFDAAYIGGAGTVRGLSAQRFAGDASLFGSLEVRLEIGRFFLLVPGQGVSSGWSIPVVSFWTGRIQRSGTRASVEAYGSPP
jgi:hypothetical protein